MGMSTIKGDRAKERRKEMKGGFSLSSSVQFLFSNEERKTSKGITPGYCNKDQLNESSCFHSLRVSGSP